MLSIDINTPSSTMLHIKNSFKKRRLTLNLTQEGLANRSGVSLGSVKRFESSGEISLKSLLALASVLECLNDFLSIALPQEREISSMDELLKKEALSATPKRGRIT